MEKFLKLLFWYIQTKHKNKNLSNEIYLYSDDLITGISSVKMV